MKTVTHEQIAAMIDAAAARIIENHEYLSRLDSATGDGDHGTTMLRIAQAMKQTITTPPGPTIAALFEALGWNVMSVDGGSIAPLLGSWFMGMGETPAAAGATADVAQLAAIFESGTAKLREQTPAKPGDKTLVDALVPAVGALRSAADAGAAVDAAVTSAAEAAAAGAIATQQLQARFGRARNLGARTIGQQDPGATSMSLLFAGFRDALTTVNR
jgi:dihydroxyacetone kinase-like protein